jgi:hypothetical protein
MEGFLIRVVVLPVAEVGDEILANLGIECQFRIFRGYQMVLLDEQMRRWSNRLRDDLRILSPHSDALASSIAREVQALSFEAKDRVRAASLVPVEARLEELVAFQKWMDLVHGSRPHPAAVRAQVITELYICFVYLGEACFGVLGKELPAGSTTRKCCKFLTENPIRALRNAVAHSNWRYLPDFSGLEFWAKKGAGPNEQPSRFVVVQEELSFWQALARCTAYASYVSLSPPGPEAKDMTAQ